MRKLAIVGLAVTVIVLVILIARLDWSEFWDSFSGLRLSWLSAACAVVALSMLVRAFRWRAISDSRRERLAPFWRATVVGYLGNMLYPARAGEAVRIVALCQTTGIRPGHAVASAFADRLADVLVMGTLAVLMFSFEKIGLHRKDLLFPVLVLTGAPILLFVGFIRWGDSFAKPMQVLACKLPRAFGARVSNWYAEAVEQTRVFRKAYVLTVAIALTFLAMSLDYASIWLGMCAMGWLMPPTAAVVVGIFIALGTMIPAAPGYIGIYQVACVVALSFYGIGESAALAFSVILQAAILVTIGTQGLIVLMHYGRRLRDLRLRADIHE